MNYDFPAKNVPETEEETENMEVSFPVDQCWLRTRYWAEKYDIKQLTAVEWVKKGYIEARIIEQPGNRHSTYEVLDLPPHKHPGWERKLQIEGVPGHIKKHSPPLIETPDDESIEIRKKKLREKYLPRLLEMFATYPERLSFTGREVLDGLKCKNQLLYVDWPAWGLKAVVIPDKLKHKRIPTYDKKKPGRGLDNKTKLAYKRDDLHNFFSGNWGAKGYSDIDDKLNANIIGAVSSEDKYFHYDKSRVFPLDSNGFFAWLKHIKPMRRDRRTHGTVPFYPLPWTVEYVKELLKFKPTGDYQYRMGVASAPRGETKTTIHILVALFRFTNGYAEKIYIAGNSKDEAGSIHYQTMTHIINDTPALKNFPGMAVKGKHIVIYQGPDDIFNSIETVATSAGLFPNMTLGLITELHNFSPEDRKFYTNFTSSARLTPNAMVLIDSTIADEGSIIHGLWKSYIAGKLKLTYFCHRDANDGYQNPETTPEFLEEERNKMTEQEFRLNYLNRWGDAQSNFFNSQSIKKIHYAGIVPNNHGVSVELDQTSEELFNLEQQLDKFSLVGVKDSSLTNLRKQVEATRNNIIDMDDLYRMPASLADMDKLAQLFGIKGWVLGVGLDRSKVLGQSPDRTVFTIIARGIVDAEESYYFPLDVYIPFDISPGFLQNKLEEWRSRYGYIDKVVLEEWMNQDLYLWCIEHGFDVELMSAVPKNQQMVFTIMQQVIRRGYFKTATVPYYMTAEGNVLEGYSNTEDIFTTELKVFQAKDHGRYMSFGAPEKRKRKSAPKDDVIDSVSWALYACQMEDVRNLVDRQKASQMPDMYIEGDVVGVY